MIIVGADLSSRTAALVALTNLGQYVEHMKLEVDVKHTKNRALVCSTLARKTQHWLTHVQASHVFIEEPVVAGAMNIRSSLLIAQVCGAILTAAGMERVVQLVPVSSWKKQTVGSGNANKDQVRAWLDEHHPQTAAQCRHDQDLYDAASVALYGQRLVWRGDDIRRGLHDESRLSDMA